MANILNIDTAVISASICIARDGQIIATSRNENTRDHATWLHTETALMLERNQLALSSLDAIAVTIGPGSYTGLRVGLAAAKGLCYGLDIPLIALNTLEVMAASELPVDESLICAAIDARRMEIFTAVYDAALIEVVRPQAMIIDESSFSHLLNQGKLRFTGNGAVKLKTVIHHPHAEFSEVAAGAQHMVSLSQQRFEKKEFADLAYIEPLYLKEFYTGKQ